jgi:hypothetical protein
MNITIYQNSQKITDINLSDTYPAEVWLTSSRHLHYKTDRTVADNDDKHVKVIGLEEGDHIDALDQRSRS